MTKEPMKLLDLIDLPRPPTPWSEGEKIPWDDPAFSERMLQEHLTQEHDLASRRTDKIDAHIEWIHGHVLRGRPGKVLDLGCGPGLYTSRLARRGHTCLGIDFAPASIAYAVETAREESLDCTYLQDDIRQADYGSGFDLAMLIFGEFNTFRPADARLILRKAHAALRDGATLLLEPSIFEAIRREAQSGPAWYASSGGLFSEHPHLCLMEEFWDPNQQVQTTRYLIVDASAGDVTRYASSSQAYTEEGYRRLLIECGFQEVSFYPSLTGSEDPEQSELLAITART